MTITVPDELKRQMNKLGRINWSDIARKAFEEAIRREEMARAAEVIDRLRSATVTPQWSGTKEIRKWRDAKSS